MSAVAVLGAVSTVTGALGSLFGDSKDKTERLPRNQFAYNLASTSRNQAAADFLKGRGGLAGTGLQVAGFGDKDTPGFIGPWATTTAVTDAKQKWQALQSAGLIDANGKIVASTSGVSGIINQVKDAVLGTGTTQAGVVSAGAGSGLMTAFLIGSAAFAIYWYGIRKK